MIYIYIYHWYFRANSDYTASAGASYDRAWFLTAFLLAKLDDIDKIQRMKNTYAKIRFQHLTSAKQNKINLYCYWPRVSEFYTGFHIAGRKQKPRGHTLIW